MYAGIDVSARRGFDLCVLDERRHVALSARAADLDALATVLRGLDPEAIIAVDAPSGPAHGLVAGPGNGPVRGYRASERALMALGISLYPTPLAEQAAAPWMQAGFALHRLLDDLGYRRFRGDADERGVSFECYPHLTYLTITGRHRGRESKLDWSRAALRGRVFGLTPESSQDALDAAAAALTSWHVARGEWISFGDVTEGFIIAPRTRHDIAGLRRGRSDQLTLALGDIGAGPVATPRSSSFSDRVLGIIERIPSGKVATYGDVARWAGKPAAARAVGTLVARHAYEVPAHRVIEATGRPSAFPEDGAARLRAEGVAFDGARVDLQSARWSGPP